MSIEVRALGVNISFGGSAIFREPEGLSFTWRSGSVHLITGANGSGKTTLFNLLAGLYQPTKGTVVIGREELMLPATFARRGRLRYVLQSSPAPDSLRIGEFVRLARVKEILPLLRQQFSDSLREQRHEISRLSGGERQYLGDAVALSASAEVYLLDEPLRGLDVARSLAVLERIAELVSKDAVVVVSEHKVEFSERYFVIREVPHQKHELDGGLLRC